MSNQDSKKQTL